MTKEVQVKFIICATETIGLVDSMRIVYEFTQVAQAAPVTFTLPSNWTTSDPDCPANAFTLTLDNDKPPAQGTIPTSTDYYKLVSDATVSQPSIWLNPTAFGEWTFYIAGESVANKYAYKEVLLTVHRDCSIEPQVITLAESGAFTSTY